MAIIVLVVAALALFAPKTCLWIQTSWVNYLLMIVMFGMGLTLKLEDFKLVFTRPKDVLIGCIAQFTIMPLLTPAITYLLLRTTVTVDAVSMFLSIIKVVIIPIALGFIINKLFGNVTQKLVKVLPSASVIAICLIVAAVVSHNSEKIMTTGVIVFAVVILHNLLGYACGFGLGKLLHMSTPKTNAISIEIGMQNSGLATSLAGTAFPDLAMATVPGAIFSVWHNISGTIPATITATKSAVRNSRLYVSIKYR